ncbi:MAG: small multi-drug export protein [Clostridia bacterium]|nr:small multi-drug export protein [Clostridia bacterium]MBR6619678.1 small multi-drug export protein [Clostridia bacterium]
MAEQLAASFVDLFQNKIPEELIIFIISLFPVLELRGGMIAASILGLDLIPSFIICYIANMIPIPFILLFIRKIFQFLRDKPFFGKVIEKLEIRSMRKSDTIQKYGKWGLLLFVAIPLPGTGGWTGALIAALLDMRIRTSTMVIAVGVFIAGVIMSVVSYGIPALIAMF